MKMDINEKLSEWMEMTVIDQDDWLEKWWEEWYYCDVVRMEWTQWRVGIRLKGCPPTPKNAFRELKKTFLGV